MKFEHEINQMFKLENKLYLLVNSRELIIVDSELKSVDLKVEFIDHNITTIFATKDFFFFGDSSCYLYAVNQVDLFKDDPRNPVLKKKRLHGHTGWILAIYIFQNHLFTCSDDKNIIVWSLPDRKISLSDSFNEG